MVHRKLYDLVDDHMVASTRSSWLWYLSAALEAVLWIVSIISIFAGDHLSALLGAGGLAIVVRSLRRKYLKHARPGRPGNPPAATHCR
jgi:hypothetical protein